MSDEHAGGFEIITAIGASIAFVVGLAQYRRGQQWTRTQFLAGEMKDLFSDIQCGNALSMIDWAERPIPLGATQANSESLPISVSYAQQVRALRPHTVTWPAGAQENSAERVVDADSSAQGFDGDGKFLSMDVHIRDCYDSLLDKFDRCGSYVQRRLISPEDLRSYIGYYVRDIAAKPNTGDEALWSVSLITYIIYYHYDGVVALFRAFDVDLNPENEVFRIFMDGIDKADREYAESLKSKAREEWRALQQPEITNWQRFRSWFASFT